MYGSTPTFLYCARLHTLSSPTIWKILCKRYSTHFHHKNSKVKTHPTPTPHPPPYTHTHPHTDTLTHTDPGCTLVLSGDGRYYNKEASALIIRIAAANGVRKIITGQVTECSCSTLFPAEHERVSCSAEIERREAVHTLGGTYISISPELPHVNTGRVGPHSIEAGLR